MIRLKAPAKLNLFLRVLGKRPDGYHELETLFERIDLADHLTFQLQPSHVTLTCDDPVLECGPSNLVMKAAALLQQATGRSRGAAIHLTKRIPIAAGLGGGSSDAATTLLGLNQLWNTRLSLPQLRALAVQVGSDVAFFLEQIPFAIGRGRGERCEALNGVATTIWHVLVTPPAQLSTKDVYQGFDGGRRLTGSTASVTMLVHALRNGSAVAELAKGLSNDLQPEAIRRCPVIQEIRQYLSTHGCAGTMVSGSGPSVFGLCEDASHAQRIARQLRNDADPSWRIAVVKTLHHSNDAAF